MNTDRTSVTFFTILPFLVYEYRWKIRHILYIVPFVVYEYRRNFRHTLYMMSFVVYEYRWKLRHILYMLTSLFRGRNVTQSFSPYKRYMSFVVYFYTLQSRFPLLKCLHPLHRCIVYYRTYKPTHFNFSTIK